MRLYHFCPRHMAHAIQREGLTKGLLLKALWPEPEFLRPWQWLTSNPEFHLQHWALGYTNLPYRRNEIRFTVDVPSGDPLLLAWSQARFLVPDVAQLLEEKQGKDDWWLYHGRIPASWLSNKCGAQRMSA